MPQDIEQKTMKHLVERIHATNYLYFTATRHNKLVYITIRCRDCLIEKVFINNGLALNVLPKHMLKELYVDESHMMARAYHGSPRQIIGALKVKLYVEPQMFLVTIQVMDIHPSCNILLGSP